MSPEQTGSTPSVPGIGSKRKVSFAPVSTSTGTISFSGPKSREQLSDMVRAADEVTLNLYTQRADFAFDLAFALEYVSIRQSA